MQDNNCLKYIKISKSQVLLHPNPQGVIQFIGSFIFGSFPACTYKYLHQFLFDRGYSLILYNFPLNPTQFNHWEVAINLLQEQHKLRSKIIEILKADDSPIETLRERDRGLIDIYLNPANYLWLGHSLGCKYIALLEILSNTPANRIKILQSCLGEINAQKIIDRLESMESIRSRSAANIRQLLPEMKQKDQFLIRDQPSVLLAPEISNTVRFLKSDWRISNPGTNPNQKQTECLISSSKNLFNLTGIISFSLDSIAEDDVMFLVEQIKLKQFQPYLYKEIEGWHFEPLGIHIENLGDRIVQIFNTLRL